LYREVYVGIGANVGSRRKNIGEAKKRMAATGSVGIKRESGIYETDPEEVTDQPKFLNQVIHIETSLKPHDLLALLQSVEASMGRERFIRFGPRIIDLDILFFDNAVINDPDLVIPHPRAHRRIFVLRPLLDMRADFIHPVFGKHLSCLYGELVS